MTAFICTLSPKQSLYISCIILSFAFSKDIFCFYGHLITVFSTACWYTIFNATAKFK